eukprot:UN3708
MEGPRAMRAQAIYLQGGRYGPRGPLPAVQSSLGRRAQGHGIAEEQPTERPSVRLHQHGQGVVGERPQAPQLGEDPLARRLLLEVQHKVQVGVPGCQVRLLTLKAGAGYRHDDDARGAALDHHHLHLSDSQGP